MECPNWMKIMKDHESLYEGDIGGYPIPQYRKKNWQIPKYRVENRRNTDTAFRSLYNRSRLIKVASISRVYLSQACMHHMSLYFGYFGSSTVKLFTTCLLFFTKGKLHSFNLLVGESFTIMSKTYRPL